MNNFIINFIVGAWRWAFPVQEPIKMHNGPILLEVGDDVYKVAKIELLRVDDTCNAISLKDNSIKSMRGATVRKCYTVAYGPFRHNTIFLQISNKWYRCSRNEFREHPIRVLYSI